jgi:hypothetical protein
MFYRRHTAPYGPLTEGKRMLEWIAAITLVLVGVAHSALGEADILKPLFAQSALEGKYPKWVTARILRFAWHLTTIAWFALAAILVGAPVPLTFAAVMITSAAVILWQLPGHFAWIPFLGGGLLAWWAGGPIPELLLWVGLGAGVLIAAVAGTFHVAWALGSQRGAANVLPQDPGSQQPLSIPPAWLTALVACALFAYAALAILATTAAAGPVRWAVIAALVIFIARVFGDGKYVGAFKSVRGTGFERADDKYWTPLVAMLALSAASALILGTL